MSYAIDLSPRQTARTLEQAARMRCAAILEPRVWGDAESIICRLESLGSLPGAADHQSTLLLIARLADQDASSSEGDHESDRFNLLLGTYSDVTLQLGDNHYLFSSDVIQVNSSTTEENAVQILLSRPEIMQVSQRRRFRRVQLAQSSQVELRWLTADKNIGGGVGWIFNLSGDGLACRTESRIAEQLWIGEQVKLEFTLKPGDIERFEVDGVLCNKMPAASLNKTILGFQFLTDSGHESSARSVESLRERLSRRHADETPIRQEADA